MNILEIVGAITLLIIAGILVLIVAGQVQVKVIKEDKE